MACKEPKELEVLLPVLFAPLRGDQDTKGEGGEGGLSVWVMRALPITSYLCEAGFHGGSVAFLSKVSEINISRLGRVEPISLWGHF